MTDDNVYHQHLDTCARCRQHPFDICPVGAQAALETPPLVRARTLRGPWVQAKETRWEQTRIGGPRDGLPASAVFFDASTGTWSWWVVPSTGFGTGADGAASAEEAQRAAEVAHDGFFECGELVRVMKAIEPDVHDVSPFIGRVGIVRGMDEYTWVIVHFAGGKKESFFPEELAHEPRAAQPSTSTSPPVPSV